MAQVPQVALRKQVNGQPAWAIGARPSHAWLASTSRTLLEQHLDEALQHLNASPEGMVVGLLPYPDASPEGTTEAALFLFREYATASELPNAYLSPEFRMLSPFAADTSKESYVHAVSAVREYLAAGDAYQVNLAQRFSGQYQGHPWHAFTKLAGRFNPSHAAWIQVGDRQVISMSPELFLAGSAKHVETHPIKGTRPRHPDMATDRQLADDLQHHPKDRAENLMIVDLLRNDFGKVCEAGSVTVPSLFRIESQPNVHHLVSTVAGCLKPGTSLTELLLACFPGGSITGAPKRRAMEIISELEHYSRDVYCGTVFWITADGSFSSNVLIRTFLAHNGTIRCWAGAGIVYDSTPEAEYTECLDKMRPLMDELFR